MEASGTPVSILICTRNRAERLRETLASVAALDVPATIRPELIVVDNASTDGTAEVLRSVYLPNMPLRVVYEPTRGAGPARNAALRAATGDILMFTDDDVALPRDWIAALCAPILEGRADAVAGRIVLAPHLHRPWMEPFHRAVLGSTEAMDERRPGEMFGGNMAFARRVLGAVPGFDPELGPGTDVGALEDTFFSWQLKQAGFRIVAAFDVVVVHFPDPSRLTREALLTSAKRLGQARAHIAYHWQHEPESAWRKIRLPYVNLTVRLIRYAVRRVVHWRQCAVQEGIARWEFAEVRNIYSVLQYLKERRRPRNYAKRGLRRLTSPGGAPGEALVQPESAPLQGKLV